MDLGGVSSYDIHILGLRYFFYKFGQKAGSSIGVRFEYIIKKITFGLTDIEAFAAWFCSFNFIRYCARSSKHAATRFE